MTDVLERILGKTKLGDSQKEELKNILIAENCTFMKTPLLNPEIYKKVNDSATSRDKGEERKQRLFVNSVIPLIKAVVTLKRLEHDTQDTIKKKSQDVSPFLHKSFKLNNTMFTDIQRKRKSDA